MANYALSGAPSDGALQKWPVGGLVAWGSEALLGRKKMGSGHPSSQEK